MFDSVADYIPLFTGVMIYISIRFAKNRTSPKKLLTAWLLGLSAQVLLVAFGVITNHLAFASHILVALAFTQNIWDSYRDKKKREAVSNA